MSSALVLRPRWIIPVVPRGVTLTDHVILIRDGKITGIHEGADIGGLAPDAHVVDLPDHVVIPGLVNTHTHAAMSLMRGMADDLPAHALVE